MKIGAIIQARSSSTRFPGKILKNLPYHDNITVLQQVIRRLKKSNILDEIIIATTTDKADAKIVKIAEKEKVLLFRGSEKNVLERYFLAAKKHDLDVVVRITSDCPCIDPNIVDIVIKNHLDENLDYTSNTLIRTFPVGLDVEAISFKALEKCFNNAQTDLEKEHVTMHIRNNLNEFKVKNISSDLNMPEIRITLDTEEDYALLCAVFDYLYKDNKFFGLEEITELFNNKPWLMIINKKIIAKESFKTFDEEVKAAVNILEIQELNQVKNFLQNTIIK